MYDWLWVLAVLLVFPGFLFLFFYSMILEYMDRKIYAWLQHRVGPPWYQPEADFVKLMAKEDITPRSADSAMVYALPLVAFAATCCTIFYIPIWTGSAPFHFQGDLIMVAYLLTIPTVALFLIGWYSSNLFTTVGAQRAMTSLFAYEIPLLLVLASPAILAGTWSISGIAEYQMDNPAAMSFTVLGFLIAVVALQGKLERNPFDIPHAETEIVGGPLTEIGGKKLAMVRLTFDILLLVGAALLAAVFMGGFMAPWDSPVGWAVNILAFVIKTLAILLILSALRALFARLRIEQMVDFSWTWLAPLAVLQLFVVILVKYFELVDVIQGWF